MMMNKYRVVLEERNAWEFEVMAHDVEDATMIARNRMEDGDWGKPNEFGNIEIYSVEEAE